MKALHFRAFSFHATRHAEGWLTSPRLRLGVLPVPPSLPHSPSCTGSSMTSDLLSTVWIWSCSCLCVLFLDVKPLRCNADYDGAHGLELPALLTFSCCFKGCIHISIELEPVDSLLAAGHNTKITCYLRCLWLLFPFNHRYAIK